MQVVDRDGFLKVRLSGASDGLTVGTTPIASGTIGRVLFQGTGNVLQQSGNLFWDDVNGRLGVGTSNPQARYHQSQTQGILARYDVTNANADQNRGVWEFYTNTAATPDFFGRFGFKFEGGINNAAKQFQLHVSDNTTPRFVVNGNGNVLINTTTDAGFRLDVNGTARVQNDLTLIAGNAIRFGSSLGLSKTLNQMLIYSGTGAGNAGGTDIHYWNGSTFVAGLRLNNNANVLINTTTDAGFRLDVNGTARVSSLTIPNFSGITSGSNSIGYETFRTLFIATFQTIANQYAFNFDDGGGNSTLTSGTTGRFQLSSRFAPTSGTAVYNTFLLNAVINQTGGANGITRGLYINPTLTAAADFRAIETTNGKVIFGNLPTSPAGLPTGAIYNNLGVLMIV